MTATFDDALDPDLAVVELVSGRKATVLPLKTRQLLRMLRILTRGAGGLLLDYPLDFEDEEALTSQLLVVLVMAIPEAEDETIDFVKSIVEPADLEVSADKATQARNAEKRESLAREFDNPELDDLLSVVEAVFAQESDNLKSLGKRLRSLMGLARKTGEVKTEESEAVAAATIIVAESAARPRRKVAEIALVETEISESE